MNQPTVLLVAPEYPPGYPVGYARLTKFEKYLPEFGFRTCVLTMRSNGTLPTDGERHVYRAFDAGMLYLPITRRYLPSARHSVHALSTSRTIKSERSHWISSALKRLRHSLLNGWMIPDLQISWLPAALLVGLYVIQAERVDVLLSSSPPETAHLVALCLAKLSRKPWVADFRDGWLFESLKPPLRQNTRRRQIEQLLESWVVSAVDAVTTVSQPITNYFHQQYATSPAKFHTLTNGYDPDDWRGITPMPRDASKFRIVHTGAFAYSRPSLDIRPFFQAMHLLPERVRANIEILLVGDLTGDEQQALTALALENSICFVGRVSRRESLAYQLSADLLLLLAGSDKSTASSKLYEYLYSGVPILVLSAFDTAAAQIVLQTGAGEVVDDKDSQAIASHLAQLVERWQAKTLISQTHAIECYDRRYLTQQLAGVLNTVIGEKQTSGGR